jgi:hypothetical protein
MFHAFGCQQQSWQLCLGCGSQVCGCAGTARGQCPVCLRGLLTAYYKIGHRCGYKGCGKAAVAATPRMGYACYACAVEKGGYNPPQYVEASLPGMPTYHTQSVLRALGYQGRADEFFWGIA